MTHHAASGAETAFYYRWRKGGDPETLRTRFSTGVSLHGHTWHSHENLAFVPNAVQKMYFLPILLRWAEGRYTQKWKDRFDYSRGYWTSPVSPAAAVRLESRQIEELGLAPLLSLTDHDTMDASRELHSHPVSIEWTAPYEGAVFHIGVHNIPRHERDAVRIALAAYTAKPDPRSLADILADLASFPDALIVFKHPLSDQGRIGFEIHESRVREFLRHHRQWLHALETNAMQPWRMNRRVAAMAAAAGLPIVAGGDRPGFEPNGVLNLTRARTFAEFVHELRHDARSAVLFMPQTQRPLALRYAENVKTLMDEYPELGGREHWYDRIFYECPDGVTRSFNEMIGHRSYALDAMGLALDALGLANLALRPITPIFAEGKKVMVSDEQETPFA